MEDSLTVLAPAQHKGVGCAVCGGPSAARMVFQARSTAPDKATRSVSRSFCERHLLEAWERCTAVLVDFRG